MLPRWHDLLLWFSARYVKRSFDNAADRVSRTYAERGHCVRHTSLNTAQNSLGQKCNLFFPHSSPHFAAKAFAAKITRSSLVREVVREGIFVPIYN